MTPARTRVGTPSRRDLPAVVLEVCDAHVAALEAALPGFVTGLHLHGSIGFGGEFHPTSDIDFVATCTRRATDDDSEVLRHVHSELSRRWPSPAYDGFYLLETDLAGRPEDVPEGPGILHDWFDVGHHGDVKQVTWHELRHHGITLHGKDLREIEIFTDDAALRAATRETLQTFWRSQLEAMEYHPREASLPQAAEWGGLGPPRLHHLLATGHLTSKSGGGRWALEAFPQHREIVLEALRVRERPDDPSRYDDPSRRREDLVAFMEEVVEDALRR